jgi:hypothetical protein
MYYLLLDENTNTHYKNLSDFSHIIAHLLLTINHYIIIDYYSQYKNIKLE